MEQKERFSLFLNEPYFQIRKGLVYSLLSLEKERGYELPNTFVCHEMPLFGVGNALLRVGYIDGQYYVLIQRSTGEEYCELYKTSRTLRHFFNTLETDMKEVTNDLEENKDDMKEIKKDLEAFIEEIEDKYTHVV